MARMTRMIKITDEVHKALLELGSKSETFSDIIQRLIEDHKKTHPKK
jgi:predicted CopG family antitoxin